MSLDTFQILYHGANVLNVVAWIVTDVLWIRSLAVAGNSLSLAFYVHRRSLYGVNIYWHAAYVAINLVQIGILLYQRRPIEFTDEERNLYETTFRRLMPHEFRKLLKVGWWQDVDTGTYLTRQSHILRDVKVLVSGSARVEADNQYIADLRPGNFVGEMSFFEGGTANADVVTSTPVRYIAWKRSDLARFLQKNPMIANVWQHALGADLVTKISSKPSAARVATTQG